MSDCVHERIVSLRSPETQLPVMWVCDECKMQFVPITQVPQPAEPVNQTTSNGA